MTKEKKEKQVVKKKPAKKTPTKKATTKKKPAAKKIVKPTKRSAKKVSDKSIEDNILGVAAELAEAVSQMTSKIDEVQTINAGIRKKVEAGEDVEKHTRFLNEMTDMTNHLSRKKSKLERYQTNLTDLLNGDSADAQKLKIMSTIGDIMKTMGEVAGVTGDSIKKASK